LQADDDVPTLQQLLDLNRVLQHDFEQAEHHRQADDDGDPYDAAALDILACLQRHRAVFRDAIISCHDGRSYCYLGENHLSERRHNGSLLEYRFIDGPAAGDRSS
jgi:hypothetical protein